MNWNEINHTHHGLTAEVTDPRPTRLRSRLTDSTFYGVIKCEKEGEVPLLMDGAERIHALAGWYHVSIID